MTRLVHISICARTKNFPPGVGNVLFLTCITLTHLDRRVCVCSCMCACSICLSVASIIIISQPTNIVLKEAWETGLYTHTRTPTRNWTWLFPESGMRLCLNRHTYVLYVASCHLRSGQNVGLWDFESGQMYRCTINQSACSHNDWPDNRSRLTWRLGCCLTDAHCTHTASYGAMWIIACMREDNLPLR